MNMMSAARRKLVVIGNGMAGMRTVEEILHRAPGMFEITVFGAEAQPNYDRIMLSPLLAGDKNFEQIVLNSLEWYAEHNIRLIAGEAVTTIDRAHHTVTGEHGTVVKYDYLLLATGSNPFVLPLPGVERPGVMTFRSVSDVEKMLSIAAPGKSAVVIGGGLLGLEAAHGLNLRGMEVSVVHLMPTLMERQLDASAAHLLERALTARGMTIYTGANTESFDGEGEHGAVHSVTLKDGRRIPADLVVMAVGIRPNANLAKASGIATDRGVLVDDAMRTSDPAIFAIGECVEHNKQCYGLVAPIWDMAKVAADHICGAAQSGFMPVASGTRLKVSGIEMFSAGAFMGDKSTEDVILRDAARGIYKRLVLRDDRLVGIVCFGDARDAGWYFQLLKDEAPLGDLRDTMIFGPVMAAGDPHEALAQMPDNAEICGCNGVKKSTICNAIAAHELCTVEDVRARTKASASCGSCTGLVEGLLKLSLGENYTPDAVKPMCKCTSHGHDEVRRRIKGGALKTIPAVMQALEWTTPNGCASCRPALNFYLLAAWPGEYVDDAQSRFVNERMHANIQKDGTYSVIPRMWGGTTTAGELRAIADVVDKFNIPAVKVTGGQRIDMLGVKKEDLCAVWQDLNEAGLVSGHAYGKSLRTVKTCVGSEWCRFGVQDSTAMGVALEKATWGSWHPHKVKLAVSGCPRNCAEATIKDFGVVATEAGWDLHVGGNGGIKVRATELLCKVTTEEEVMEYACAFLQLYRMEARYLERTAPWIERAGLKYVQERIVDNAELRRSLFEDFLHAQKFAQTDPWAQEATSPALGKKFNAMAELV
ncbi:nitrite reductase large subunit [Acidocella aquatica]|uniref:Nitrite reductase large subunit n=1 Tax=Acidocella aquatica TaxID=1922313 RepID=A0ABQ6A0R1_9PROT|nr:nitrite reductase large subunit NirB [Acidocella aquatica]GLR65764.1 nitrite reductase large subunit [Acidocella aquatica]